MASSSSEELLQYSGNTLLVEFFRDVLLTKEGKYSINSSGITSTSAGVTSSTKEQGNMPIGLFPRVSLDRTYFYTSQYFKPATGDPQQNDSVIESLTYLPVLIDSKKETFFYIGQQSRTTSSLSAGSQYSLEITLNLKDTQGNVNKTFSFGQQTNELVALTHDFSFLYPGTTLDQDHVYTVLPRSDYSNNNLKIMFWDSKKFSDYIKSPNIYNNPDPTKALSDVPVWAVEITQLGNESRVEVKDDILVKHVYPLLSGAVVLAASYHP